MSLIYILFYSNHEANVSNFKCQETRTSIVTITIFITLQLLGAVQFMTKILQISDHFTAHTPINI